MKQKKGDASAEPDLFGEKLDQILEGRPSLKQEPIQKEEVVIEDPEELIMQTIMVDYCCGCGCNTEKTYVVVKRKDKLDESKKYDGVPTSVLDWDSDKKDMKRRFAEMI